MCMGEKCARHIKGKFYTFDTFAFCMLWQRKFYLLLFYKFNVLVKSLATSTIDLRRISSLHNRGMVQERNEAQFSWEVKSFLSPTFLHRFCRQVGNNKENQKQRRSTAPYQIGLVSFLPALFGN